MTWTWQQPKGHAVTVDVSRGGERTSGGEAAAAEAAAAAGGMHRRRAYVVGGGGVLVEGDKQWVQRLRGPLWTGVLRCLNPFWLRN
jgi:hypothetical protein